MNQLSPYMASTAQPGYTRRFFSAHYVSATNSTSNAESAEQQSIVLCIDRGAASQSGSTNAQESVQDTVVNTFEAAIALAEQDALLQYVASWLNQDLEWQPVQLTPPVAVDVTLTSVQTAEHRIGLCFGRSAKDLPLPPSGLDELVIVQEHNRSLLVCLAQLHLSADDQQRLQPGSCIVLPDTFQETSTVSLFDMRSDQSVAQGVLDRCQKLLIQTQDGVVLDKINAAHSDAVTSVDSTAQPLTRVYLQQPVAIDLSIKSTSIDFAPMVGQAVVIQCSGPDGTEEYVAHLIQVGSGLAALLDND